MHIIDRAKYCLSLSKDLEPCVNWKELTENLLKEVIKLKSLNEKLTLKWRL